MAKDKLYVHIDPIVVASNKEAKTALTKSLSKTIDTMLVDMASKALPKDKFSTKKTDKPKKSDSWNAIKITERLKLSVEPKGSKVKVICELGMVFEAIKMPNTRRGSLLGQASTRAATENRGSGEKVIALSTGDCLDAAIGPLVKKMHVQSPL